jgi:Ca2+-binding RTX toxin-like protein
MGRGSGGKGKGSGSNQYGLSYEFELFTLKDNGTPSTFTGAIEKFNGSFTESSDVNAGFDFFLNNSRKTITFPNQTTNLAASSDQFGIKYNFAPTKYEYVDDLNNSRSGTVELEFLLVDDDRNQAGFQVREQNGSDRTITVEPGSAISSIDYIVSQGLFNSVDAITVKGKNAGGNPVSVQVAGSGIATFTPINPTDNPPTDPVLNGDDVLTGDNGDNTLNGGEGNNVLRGKKGNDVLETGSGSDNLDGGKGNDTLRSGGGNDTLTGGGGNDIIDGGGGNDIIDGGSKDDLILGGEGDDLINGGNGKDTLNGGAGQDVLVGDGGADIFALNTLGGADVIRDFNYGKDLIGLSDGITFDDLVVTQGNGAAIINYQGQDIGSVSGATPSQLGASFFTAI